MKIALVIERIEAWRGGAETSTMEQARLLAERGHDIHIITASRCPSPPDLTIHMIKLGGVLRPLHTSAFVRKAAAFLQGHSFDLVHAISPFPQADIYQPRGGLVRETLERNVAMRASISWQMAKQAMQAMNYKQQQLLELEKRIMRADGPIILCVSKYVAEQCHRHYGLSGDRVQVVYNGVMLGNGNNGNHEAPLDIRSQYGIAEDALLLLFVAHNFRLKGLLPLLQSIQAMVKQGKDNFRLLVVGRDNLVRFQRKINALKLEPYVTFTGPSQRTSAFYQAADVCILPSYYDPCSRVILEALSWGLPCITTRFNGASEVMTQGQEGYILESPDDVTAMSDSITKLHSKDRRQAMSQHALKLRDRLNMSRHVDELETVYKDVYEQKQARALSTR